MYNANEPICSASIKPRKIKPQNIVCRLIDREHGTRTKPGAHLHAIRDFYKCIYPNLTVINVEKPAGFLRFVYFLEIFFGSFPMLIINRKKIFICVAQIYRKFSPDGKYLIAFTLDQTSLEIYKFNGVVAAAKLINAWKTEVVPNTNTDLPYTIRNQIFDKLFKVSRKLRQIKKYILTLSYI